MHYVLIRDDDTNALTPPECLERLYRVFLDRGLPVNLAVIPAVRTTAQTPAGKREDFVWAPGGKPEELAPLQADSKLVRYLLANPLFHIAQHGLHHDYFEFDLTDGAEAERKLKAGTRLLIEAGLPAPSAFVAPHDKFSRSSLAAAARIFPVISTGWFEHRRMPLAWWPGYLAWKFSGETHWRMRSRTLLTHPGCLLSRFRDYQGMLSCVKSAVQAERLTVLVTHWWEYFPEGQPDEAFIDILHELADWLESTRDVEVITFAEIATNPAKYLPRSGAERVPAQRAEARASTAS